MMKAQVAVLNAALIMLIGCGQEETVPKARASAEGNSESVASTVKTSSLVYDGVCEASAAAMLDASHFVVASDDSERLTIYRRGQAAPVHTVEHSGVTDLEGAARVGDTIFWMTSHSLNKDGEDKPKRKALFATAISSGPILTDSGTVFKELRQHLASQLGVGEAELAPWLNIEGVASTPEGNLLVGLRRAPVGDTRAYVLGVDNPSALVSASPQGGAAPAKAQVWRLDLGARGIRSMEQVGNGAQAYLILAGPREDEVGSFTLFWWDGASEKATPGPAVSFGDMAPEALIAWPDGEIQILGDNEGSGPGKCSEKADDPRPRRFPALSLRQ